MSRGGCRWSKSIKSYLRHINYLSRITTDPAICHGKPIVRGMRWPVAVLLGLLASGMSQAEVLEEHPELEAEDILAALHYASLLASGQPLGNVVLPRYEGIESRLANLLP